MIRQELIEWRSVTEKLLLETGKVADETRDEAIDTINELLTIRENLQPKISAPFTFEEDVFGKELVTLETDLKTKMALFNKQIRINISELQAKKDNMQSYMNPYSKISRDGTYYDSKQ